MLTCPKCGTALDLTLRVSGGREESQILGPQPHRPSAPIQFTLARRQYSLSKQDIEDSARQINPSTILKYFVNLHGQRFPIKQVVRKALQVKSGDRFVEDNFTAHRARDILRRLGFEVKEQ